MKVMTMSTNRAMTPTKILKEAAAADRRGMKGMTMSTNRAMTPTKILKEAAAADLEMKKILTPVHYWKIKNSSKM